MLQGLEIHKYIVCQPGVRADLSSFCSCFEKAAGGKQSPLNQMNNPIDVASLPLMKLSFVFAVYQRDWRGFCLTLLSLESNHLTYSGFTLLWLPLLEEMEEHSS